MAARNPGRRSLAWLLSLLALVLAYGTVGYAVLEGWSLLDALYMTVITLSTVGFREVRPLDASGRVFTMTLIALGVGLVLVAASVLAARLFEEERWVRRGRLRMQRRIEAMRDHFIVCAYGRVGRAVARELEGAGAPFVVVDPLESLEPRMIADGVTYLIDDPSLEPALRAAGVERARGLICAVDSDATNVYIVLMARQLNPDLFIVARASEPGSDERLIRAGADRVVSPFVSSGRHMAALALNPRVADVLRVEAPGAGTLELDEIRVDVGSTAVGRSVGEVAGGRPALAVRHAGGDVTPNPPPDLRLAAGDLLIVLGTGERIRGVP